MHITTLIETSSLSSILNTHHVEFLTFNNNKYNYKLFSNGPSVDSKQWKTFNNKKYNYKHFSNGPSVDSRQWKTGVSFFQGFLARGKDVNSLKDELFEAIAPLDRGALATPEDQQRIDQIARSVEAVNQIKEPLKSNLLNGKWELLYTTS